MLKKIYLRIKSLVFRYTAYKFFIHDWKQLTDLQSFSDALATMRFSINLEPIVSQIPNGSRILVIAPHPDDEMIGPGGTILKSIDAGSEVLVLYLSRGRRSETQAAVSESKLVAAEVGYQQVFLNSFSKEINLDQPYLNEAGNVIENFKPQIIMLPFFSDDHDDHRRASHLLYLLNKTIRLPSIQVWAYQVYSSLLCNVVVDITEKATEKRRLIKKWKSQNQNRDWAHFALGMNAFNSRFLTGASKQTYCEMFFVIPLPEYCNFTGLYFSDVTKCYYTESYKK